jgi:hypothetical protein
LPNKDLNSEDFESMVDTMVQQVYSCGCCLSFKHDTSSCTNEICCKSYFHYGHIKKNCLNSRGKTKWVPKAHRLQVDTEPPDSPLDVAPPLSPVQTCPDSSMSPPPYPSPGTSPVKAAPVMAVFELDPTRWVPQGHQIEDGGPTRLP